MNRKSPKVSVIMPVYNAEKYLRQCLDSIVNQTLKDIEIICVNDGSTDNSLDILKQYAAKDERFKIYNKRNTGPADTRNVGLKKASGEYLWFVDADDECALNACEIIYKKMSQNNLDVLCFCANVYSEKEQKEVDFPWYNSFGNIISYNNLEKVLIFNNYLSFGFRINGPLWNKAFSNHFINKNNVIFNSNIFINDDKLFYLYALINNPVVMFSLDKLYTYRQDFTDNVVGEIRKSNRKIFDIFIFISDLTKMVAAYDNKKLKKEVFEEILRNLSYWGSVVHPDNKKEFFDKARSVLIRLSSNFPEDFFQNSVSYSKCIAFFNDGNACNYKVKSKKVLGITIYEKYKDDSKKYKKFFGLTYFSQKKKKDKIYYKVLGIPLYSVRKTPTKLVKRFLGLPLYSKKTSAHKSVKKFLGVPWKKTRTTTKYQKKYFLGVQYGKKSLFPCLSATTVVQSLSQKQIDDIVNKVSQVTFASALRAIDCAEQHKKTFSEFKATLEDKNFVLLATGPTVNYFHPITNAVYGGCNKAFRLSDYKLDYLFMQDWLAIKDYIKEIQSLDCIKFLGSFFYNAYKHIFLPEDEFVKYSNVRRYYSGAPVQDNIYPNIAAYPLYDRYTVAHIVLQFALYAGAKKIYLVGCDTSNSGYFDKSSLPIPLNIKGILAGYKKIKEFASVYYPETEIISVNPVGLKGMFRDVYTEAYLADHPEIDRNSVEILENLDEGE